LRNITLSPFSSGQSRHFAPPPRFHFQAFACYVYFQIFSVITPAAAVQVFTARFRFFSADYRRCAPPFHDCRRPIVCQLATPRAAARRACVTPYAAVSFTPLMIRRTYGAAFFAFAALYAATRHAATP
jgi:hypothetical protein